MKKLLVVALMLVAAVSAFGCGRNAQFGVVDVKKVETESPFFKTVKEDANKKMQALQTELMKELEGKSQEEAQKIVTEKRTKAQVLHSEAQNKMKASFDAAVMSVAKEKNLTAILIKEAVPQGGVDVTQDVIKKME